MVVISSMIANDNKVCENYSIASKKFVTYSFCISLLIIQIIVAYNYTSDMLNYDCIRLVYLLILVIQSRRFHASSGIQSLLLLRKGRDSAAAS